MKRSTMYLRMITASLARRKSRMLVALLAVTVGSTILAGLVMVYYDMPRQMGEQFLAYGANMIFVPSSDSDGMTSEEIEQAALNIEGDVEGVISYCYESATINDAPVVVAGCDLNATLETSPYWQIEGALPQAKGEILVGLNQADFFSLHVGDKVTVSYIPSDVKAAIEGENLNGEVEGKVQKEFTVSGLLDTGSTEEDYFFISEEDMAALTGETLTYDVTELRVNADSDALAASVERIQQAVPGVTPQLVKRITESQTTVLSKLSALVLLVTIITLALTMICVATTMTAVVTERRREIGLRKALGASDKSIMLEFMGEGLMLGLIGGLLGSLLGFGFAYLVSTNVFNSTITFLPALVPVTVFVALAVTALACIMPVRNATKVDPALVLKGE
ncbi:MAG: FtsX-like permease family protein [Coriobacteriia bacterium]|nr:FtsX-like permease family protein [Coriobacteriia bacterium]